MRKLFWMVLALAVIAGAPVAHANPYTAVFSCSYGCTKGPTIPPVTFPAPTFTVTFFGSSFTFDFASNDLVGNTYNWNAVQTGGIYVFFIDDETTGVDYAESVISEAPVNAAGNLTFSAATTGATPEPGSLALIALGFAALLVMRNRMRHAGTSSV